MQESVHICQENLPQIGNLGNPQYRSLHREESAVYKGRGNSESMISKTGQVPRQPTPS